MIFKCRKLIDVGLAAQQNVAENRAFLPVSVLLTTKNSIMGLDEGTCICLLFGTALLIIIWKDLMSRKMAVSQFVLASAQPVPQPPVAVPAAPANPPLSAEEERNRIEAQLEARNRDRWCREFEEQEVARQFRQKYFQQELEKHFNEEAKDEQERRMRLQMQIFRRYR